MDRIASPTRMHAEGAIVDWREIVRRRIERLENFDAERELAAVADREPEVHLRWACSATLGVPPGPFTVWTRKRERRPSEVELRARRHPLGILIEWDGRTAVTLEVEFEPRDASRPVVLWGFRGAPAVSAIVAVETAHPAGSGRMSLLLRSSGMTSALLVNGDDPRGVVDYLRELLDDEDWRELEIVGLPVDSGGWSGTDYDTRSQGPVDSPLDPVDAATYRLKRGGPPLGWWPLTEQGVVAPDWGPPDYDRLVEEVRKELMAEIESLYSAGLPPYEQAEQRITRDVPPPEQDGHTSTASSSAELPPFGALALAASTDPFLALATGFGTTYPIKSGEWEVFGNDFLITADYPETPEGGAATYAAFVPWPEAHHDTAPVTDLEASRSGLVRPAHRDDPWRETVQVRWNHVEATAALGRPSGAGMALYEPGGTGVAECLITPRDSGGWRTLIPTRAAPRPGGPPADYDSAVDPAREIPICSGSRMLGYAVAVHDVFGIWAPWRDAIHVGEEPAPPAARILAVTLDASFAGSSLCPATTEVEFALDWRDRAPDHVDLFMLLFSAASEGAASPIASPSDPTPPDCIRADLSIGFAGDVPLGPPGVGVRCLDVAGNDEVPPGPAQSDEARRYVVTVDVPPLDYAATGWWGLAVWGQETAVVLPSAPGPLSPSNGPALAFAATPVPPALSAPPPLPGVPVGSGPDSEGRSHVRVEWGDPAGPADRCVVWEVAETAVRTAAGLAPRAGDEMPPGARLVELRAAYDGLDPVRRRALFRRVAERPAGARDVDVALARGSTDIHLFAVTAVGPGNVESGWPPDHTHLRAFMSPRIRAPSAPSLAPSFVPGGGGAVQLRLDVEALSEIPVERFLLFRTRSEVAARSAETMGPDFAEVAAADGGEPEPRTPNHRRRYTGSWTGLAPEGWEPMRHRAVAVPVPAVPVEAARGVPSAGSPQVPVQVPPSTPPDLDPPVADEWDGTGLVVRTATAAPVEPTPFGSHVLRAAIEAGGAPLYPRLAVPLDEAEEVADATVPSPGTDSDPLVVRAARAGGRTPLALWFRRPAVSDAVRVVLRLADPLGKVAERALDIPGGALGEPPSLDVLEFFAIAGRGVFVRFQSDAPITEGPEGPHVLSVAASPAAPPGGFEPPFELPRPPGLPGPGFPRPGLPRPPRPPLPPRPPALEIPLPDIPEADRGTPFPPTTRILVVRVTSSPPFEYSLLVRAEPPLRIVIAVTAPDGLRTARTVTV